MQTDTQKTTKIYDSRTADKFVLRLPEGLRARIAQVAEQNHRSMNGEMIARIDDSLDLEAKYEEMRILNRYLLNRVEMLETGSIPKVIALPGS
ncbi:MULTISPECIES: Arc family DNA-binding protein [Pseudomonas]|uniref:Arc family DNA-binding protein n=1 Tax=Pseudomonas TaxID=286 RepID=UPI0009F6B0E0|nr:Arc family DNA-binding protein [Pseudomonas viridiflava]MEE4911819.1 Arc family DNA-binding protein [Pseudomonas alliivorans]